MKETSKANRRRAKDELFLKAFHGRGIDLGSGDDPFDASEWPCVDGVEPFDLEHGDAQFLTEYREAGTYDFVHASNCLEHMRDPHGAMEEWFAMLKIGGYLVFTVPDEDIYEQGVWPSRWNQDHKWTFTVHKHGSWSPVSVNVTSLFARLRDHDVLRIARVDTNYDYDLWGRGIDQTFPEDGAEAFIEVVVRKREPIVVGVGTFKHSGARGDLIYGLPVIKAMGGGILCINLSSTAYVGAPIRPGSDFDRFAELLLTQPYIKEVRPWNGEAVEMDLDKFREIDVDSRHLAASHLQRFGIDFDLSKPWLEMGSTSEAPVIINRSPRYHGYLDWGMLRGRENQCAFVGLKKEWQEFIETTGLNIRFVETTYLEMARMIAGSHLFVGNQSFPLSLAEAMKVPRVVEVCDDCPNCMPQSENGHTALTHELLAKYVDGEGGIHVSGGSRVPHLRKMFIPKRAEFKISNPFEYRPDRNRSSITVFEVGGRLIGSRQIPASVTIWPKDRPFNAHSHDDHDELGWYVMFVMRDVELTCGSGEWWREMLLPFAKMSVGLVGLDLWKSPVYVVSRKALEDIGFDISMQGFQKALDSVFSLGYTVIACDSVRVVTGGGE